jgi:hypothetical protein
MENTTNQSLLNKQLQRHQILFDEFTIMKMNFINGAKTII